MAPSASLLRRSFAGIVDVYIAILITLGIGFVTGSIDPIFDPSPGTTTREIDEAYFRIFGSTFTALVVHSALAEMTVRVTAGKFIAGIQSVDDSGNALSKGRALMRNLAKFVSVYLFGVGLAWALIDRRNRTWHDLMVGTYVAIHAEPVPE